MAQLILFEAMTRSEDSAGDKSQTPANSGGKSSATVLQLRLEGEPSCSRTRYAVAPVIKEQSHQTQI
ncbi:hypothetical protein FG475_18810 [Vibrio navarrensis]|uniref:hypothetical protein n=1 Tax=Vibrio navarrensis TaxID=29495 RepID=UPI0018DD217C|nr:hypothetical protein [Vibrio navarrensis]EHA1127129.1 hypothetical protein [Vibrio navarrensis]